MFKKSPEEYTKNGLKIINLLLKIVSKYQLAKLLDIHLPNLYRWLKGEHGISEFYYKVLLQMYSFIKGSTGPDGKFSKQKRITRIKNWKEEPAYKELRMRLNPFYDLHESYVFETNKKILQERYKSCQLCGATNRKLEVHHIITRGEAAGHSMVHTLKNLILLCDDCHRIMHEKKKIRDILVKDRKLYFLKRVDDGGNSDQTNAVDS